MVQTVRTHVEIAAVVVDGTVSEAELQDWLQRAVAHYHEFRGGWVTVAQQGILKPTITPVYF